LYLPPSATVDQRFLVKAELVESSCWQWLGSRTYGYGLFVPNGDHWRAHRWGYTRWRGPIPAGLTLDHLCRNRGCVNPWHLEAVTMAENDRRGKAEQPAVFPSIPDDQRGILLELAEASRLRADLLAA
jgi:hypothetical protein